MSLILVAASGLAREVLALVRTTAPDRQVLVLDDDTALWGSDLDGAPVAGGLDLVTTYVDHEVLVCAGRGTARRSIASRLSGLGVTPDRYARAVHPSVEMPSGCMVGCGTIMLANVSLTANPTVGKHVVVMPNVTLTHDDVVEDFATIASGVSLGGGVHVETGAYLGMNSSVREGVRVGKEALLGMGAALLEDLPPESTWVGVPARPITVSNSVRGSRCAS